LKLARGSTGLTEHDQTPKHSQNGVIGIRVSKSYSTQARTVLALIAPLKRWWLKHGTKLVILRHYSEEISVDMP
jgi:hypothetical protein